ncbi:hypothetical protein EDI28_25540 [Photobacterium chitinilyticum]|uniref:Uncharacterized protein n=1 Tax=Photobacterium chitinilyticum TaxID=2485123 RepID=A0A444JI65_9GAMM|nr:hypothetical protein EDI28_25540 [Photobacterium chitinilyticum]
MWFINQQYNKAIKVTRYTRRFWYGVRCALLVQCGAPYCRRYGVGEYKERGDHFIARRVVLSR